MAVTADHLAADVADGMYAARHGLSLDHLKLLWNNLGRFVAQSLSSRKVRFRSFRLPANRGS